MRKLLLAGVLAATIFPSVAQAQSAGELRGDRRDIRQEQRDLNRDYRDGASRREIRDDRRDVRDARREYRDDWRDYRRAHPDRFRGPAYAGPRGYAYRPVAVGYRFAPAYYNRRYWVDPYAYRLRPVGRYDRWVRYGSDVVRIDIRNGRTLEVHGGFFF